MSDNNARRVVLQRLYDRREGGRFLQSNEFDDLSITENRLFDFLKQLDDLGLADGKFIKNYQGGDAAFLSAVARITTRGIDAIENPETAPPQVMVDHSINVHGSQNIQVGNYNQQTVNLDIGKLNAAIDHSAATMEEKGEAKSLLKRLSENKLLISVLAWALPSHPAS
jgi:hypothetical protein